MPLMLITLLPIEWTRHAGIAEAIAYSVYGLPSEKRTIIAMRPGGWRVVRDTLIAFDQGRVYSSAEEAAAALKAWIESGRPRAGEGGMMAEPAACYQSAISPHRCSKCSCYPLLVHIPTQHTGYYCSMCCPACSQAAAKGE
jgi:hypothetical protein